MPDNDFIDKAKQLATKKIGPVPVWLLVVGAGGALYWYRTRYASNSVEDTQAAGTDTGQLTDTQGMPYYDGGLPASGYPAGYYGGGVDTIPAYGGADPSISPTQPDVLTCPEGSHWDADLLQCVPNTQGTVTCPPDTHWDGIAAACIPDASGVKCPPGSHWDDAKQGCAPDTLPKPIHNCPPGTHWTAAKKKCTADKAPPPNKCGPNHHKVNGKCVPDHKNCGDGMHWNGKKCVHDKMTTAPVTPRHGADRRTIGKPQTPIHPQKQLQKPKPVRKLVTR